MSFGNWLPSLPRHGSSALDYPEPFRRFHDEFHKEMERLMRDFSGKLPSGREGMAGFVEPSLDVSETDKEIRISAELPGVEEKDIELTVTGDRLTLKGEKKQEKEEKGEGFHLLERSYGSFSRSLPLPFTADPAGVKAKFEKGVLKISIPKPPEAETKSARVAIKTKD